MKVPVLEGGLLIVRRRGLRTSTDGRADLTVSGLGAFGASAGSQAGPRIVVLQEVKAPRLSQTPSN